MILKFTVILFRKLILKLTLLLTLHFSRSPRHSRNGEDIIIIRKKKQASENERMMTLFTVVKWGWNNSSATFKMKVIVAKAAFSQVAYDYGFKNSFATSQLPAWERKQICNWREYFIKCKFKFTLFWSFRKSKMCRLHRTYSSELYSGTVLWCSEWQKRQSILRRTYCYYEPEEFHSWWNSLYFVIIQTTALSMVYW